MKETGCAAVKLEGGEAMAPTIEFLTNRGIPVIGHVGLTPQAVNVLGGYGARGREEREAEKILADAQGGRPTPAPSASSSKACWRTIADRHHARASPRR